MKKTLICLMLAAALALASASCGSSSTDSESGSTESTDDIVEYDPLDYVKLGQYKDLTVTLDNDYSTDKDAVEEYMQKLINESNGGSYQKDDTKSTVKEDSIVNVDYKGIKDGTAFEGGSAADQTIDVAGNCDAATGSGYIDGFTDGLVGANVGDTVDSEVTFPDDYGASDLAGETVTFEFTINYICKEVTVDDVSDDYLKENFDCDSKDEFYDYAKKKLKAENKTNKQSEIRSKVSSAVTENCTVDSYPDGLISERVADYQTQFENNNLEEGETLEDYLKSNYNISVDDFQDQVKDIVQDNIKTELIFMAIAEKEDITLDDDGFNTYCNNLIASGDDSDVTTKEDLYLKYGSTSEKGKNYLQTVYLCNKALDFCVDSVSVK